MDPRSKGRINPDLDRATEEQPDQQLSEEQVLALFEQLVAELDGDAGKRKAV